MPVSLKGLSLESLNNNALLIHFAKEIIIYVQNYLLLIVVGESPEALYTVTAHLNKTNKNRLLERQIGVDIEKGTVIAGWPCYFDNS